MLFIQEKQFSQIKHTYTMDMLLNKPATFGMRKIFSWYTSHQLKKLLCGAHCGKGLTFLKTKKVWQKQSSEGAIRAESLAVLANFQFQSLEEFDMTVIYPSTIPHFLRQLGEKWKTPTCFSLSAFQNFSCTLAKSKFDQATLNWYWNLE